MEILGGSTGMGGEEAVESTLMRSSFTEETLHIRPKSNENQRTQSVAVRAIISQSGPTEKPPQEKI